MPELDPVPLGPANASDQAPGPAAVGHGQVGPQDVTGTPGDVTIKMSDYRAKGLEPQGPPPPEDQGPPEATMSAAPGSDEPVELGPVAPTNTFMDAAKEFWKYNDPIQGVKGAAEVINAFAKSPIKTTQHMYMADAALRQKVWDGAQEAWKSGDYGAAAARALYAMIPILGPAMAEEGQNFAEGKWAKGIGGSIGIGTAIAGPEAVGSALDATGNLVSSIGNRMGKGTLGAGVRGAEAAKAETNLMFAHGLGVSPEAIDALHAGVKDLHASVASIKDAIKLPKSLEGLTTEDLLSAAEGSTADFMKKIQARMQEASAKAAKEGKATASATGLVDASGQPISSAIAKVSDDEAKLAQAAFESFSANFPEIKEAAVGSALRQSTIADIKKSIGRAVNQHIMGVKLSGAAGAVVGAVIGKVSHSVLGGLGGSLATAVLVHALRDPVVSSKLATMLFKGSKGAFDMAGAYARLEGYQQALGNYAEQSGEGQEGQ